MPRMLRLGRGAVRRRPGLLAVRLHRPHGAGSGRPSPGAVPAYGRSPVYGIRPGRPKLAQTAGAWVLKPVPKPQAALMPFKICSAG